MDDLETIKTIGTWVSGIGATGILVFIVWRFESGKWKTETNHNDVVNALNLKHEEVVKEVRESETRAWDMVEKLTDARLADNAVLAKFADNIRDLKEVVNGLRSTVENPRARR